MYAKVIHNLIEWTPGMHPDHRAMLHEQVAEETAAAMNAAPGDGGASAAGTAAPTAPTAPAAEAAPR